MLLFSFLLYEYEVWGGKLRQWRTVMTYKYGGSI